MNDKIINYIQYHPIRTQRGLEILTGLIPWSIILFPLIGSFFIPEIVAYFVIAFNVYWLYRSIQMVIFAFIGYLNIKGTEKVDWRKKLPKNLPINVVIVSIVKEPLEIIARNLDSLKSQNFPPKKIVVVLGMEDRVGQEAYDRAKILLKKYKNKFGFITATFHKLAPGETIGKHSNEAFAAKAIKKTLVDQKKVPLNKIILTTADADCVFPPQYLSLLTYKFLNDKNRYQNFYQAPLFMYNNLHRVPLLVRIPSIVSG
ncbi:glycosyltransferase family 2 protein, partial [Candidatus Gottesmanbacteria bacterium]|nr:glycosyltransferase family 2 protein [Candidatus Gottesmanbacteria bacterium]